MNVCLKVSQFLELAVGMVKIRNCRLHRNDFIRESVLFSSPFRLAGNTFAITISGPNHCCCWEAQLL